MSENPTLCTFLPWDSDHFKLRIGRLESNNINAEVMQSVREWCREESIDCLYFLADPNDPETTKLALSEGFCLVDTRVTLSLKINNAKLPVIDADQAMRIANKDDLGQLKGLAGIIHDNTRFYRDGNFDLELCKKMYAIWIEQNVLTDVVLVCYTGQELSGYISCLIKDNGSYGQIGLVAVSGNSQGRGYGRALVENSIVWFANNGCQEVKVVTQGHNIPALRLYERCGFLTESCQLWFHKWFK